MSVDLGPWLASVPAGVAERLGSARSAIVVSHENPDADTLGAALGIAAIVEGHGGRAQVVCTDPVPPLYGFLAGVERFRTDPEPTDDADLLVLCDCGSLDRIGGVGERQAAWFARLPRLIVDHHASNGDAGPGDWVDPEAAATCELVALLAVQLGLSLATGGGALAGALMAGIVMDTATFAHPNATPRTLAVAAALVDAGAPLSEISRRLYRTKPDPQLRLFGRVLSRLETSPSGRVVHSSLTLEDIAASGAIAAHSEGIIDLLAQSETAEVAILLKEAEPDVTRVSIRTRSGGVDATVLAGRFGGGGHPRAAGATVAAPLAIARARVLEAAEALAAAVRR